MSTLTHGEGTARVWVWRGFSRLARVLLLLASVVLVMIALVFYACAMHGYLRNKPMCAILYAKLNPINALSCKSNLVRRKKFKIASFPVQENQCPPRAERPAVAKVWLHRPQL